MVVFGMGTIAEIPGQKIIKSIGKRNGNAICDITKKLSLYLKIEDGQFYEYGSAS